MKRKKIHQRQAPSNDTLLFQLHTAQQDAEAIFVHLNLAKDPALIENLIYKHAAAQIRLRQYFKKARTLCQEKHDFPSISAKK